MVAGGRLELRGVLPWLDSGLASGDPVVLARDVTMDLLRIGYSAAFLIVLFGFIAWICWLSFRDEPRESDDWS
jgi:hypothetical protein